MANLTTRKTTFKQDMLAHVQRIPGGTNSYRAYLERTALATINDLARLGILPFKLNKLTPDRIASLVYLWKNEKLSQKTIANRLSVLRAIPEMIVPTNEELRIKLKTEPKNFAYLKP